MGCSDSIREQPGISDFQEYSMVYPGCFAEYM